MCPWQVLHGLGVLDELLHHQEPARAITFASPSFQTLFSVPDSIVCFGPLTSSFILFDMSLTSICHMPAIQVWLVSSIKLSGYQAIRLSSYQLSDVLLGTALPRQSSALPITQYDSFVAQCLLPPQ